MNRLSHIISQMSSSCNHSINKIDTTSKSHKKLKIAIVGGSLSGLFTARALESLGHDIYIFERRTDHMTGGGITVTTPMMEFLHKYKIFNSLETQNKNLIPTITTSTINNNGKLMQKIHPETVRRHTTWDCLYYNLLTPFLSSRLTTGKNVINIIKNEDKNSQYLMQILFDDNTSFLCDLIIGADGVGSNVRNFVSNNKENKMDYAGYVAWRGIVGANDFDINDSMYNWQTDHQWVLYHGLNTQFLNYIVPQYNNNELLYNWVWYIKYTKQELNNAKFLTDKTGNMRKIAMPRGFLSDNGKKHVYECADKLLEQTCNRLVKMTKEPFYQVIYDWKSNSMTEYFTSNNNMKEGGIVLIGDAAFTIRPHITKATSKAAGDAMCLEKFLSQLGNGMCLEDALYKFNKERSVEGNDLLNKAKELGNKVVLQTQNREFNQEYIRSSKG